MVLLRLGVGGSLDGALGGEDDDLALVVLLGLDATHQVLGLGLGHELVKGAQAHAQQVGHLLLLHLGLELQELEGTNHVAHALGLGVGLLGDGVTTVAQKAGGTLCLVKEDGVAVLLLGDGLLGLLGLLVGSLLGLDDLLGLLDRLLSGLQGLVHHVLVLGVLRHASPSAPHGRSQRGAPCAASQAHKFTLQKQGRR